MSTSIATNLGSAQSTTRWCHVCYQSHHNDHPSCQRLAFVQKKSSSNITFHVQLVSEGAEDLWHKPCDTADLHHRCHARANAQCDPNIMINVGRPLNASKRQCHLMITMTVIATIIVMCQHMCNLLPHCNWIECNIQLWVDRDAVGAKAKLLLASKMLDSSNNFHFYLGICQKVTACATVPTNASDATWTTIIVNAFLSQRKREYFMEL